MRANHQLESRMRETRLSGSEGGAAQQCAVPTPIGSVSVIPLFLERATGDLDLRSSRS